MSPPDISDLNASQQEALQTYTAVTDQDPIAAIPILQRSEWNVQIAIARFFDGEPATDPLAEARAALPAATARQTTNLQYESLLGASGRASTGSRTPADVVERIDTGVTTETHYAPPFILSAVLAPLNIMYRVLTTVLSPFSFLIPSFVLRIFSRIIHHRSRPIRRTLPPAENARRFIREFGEEYGDHSLPFVESGFNLALDNTKKDFKFLLVVLLSPSHDDNQTWVRETLLSPQVRTFIDSHRDQVVLWGGNVQDAEGYQVSSNLNCSKFPFIALVCQSAETGSSAMTVAMRAVGLMPASELVAKLGTAITTHRTHLQSAQVQRADQQAQRSLRQEQDSAYERSLAQDRERARIRREEQEAQSRAEKVAADAAQAKEIKKQKLAQWRLWRARSIPQEPSQSVKDAARLSIRLPSGERVIRKFLVSADLEELYAFVECHDILKGGHDTTIQVEEPADFEHKYPFRIVSPMPRTVYDIESGGSIIDRIGKSGNIIIERIDEGDGESDDDV